VTVDDVLRHPLFVAVLAPLVVAFAVGTVGLLRRIAATASKMDAYVLPHFEPHPDRMTLPAKVDALTDAQATTDHNLLVHMGEEERLRAKELERRDAWRGEVDRRFDKIDEKLG
jgi:hypothetical protein